MANGSERVHVEKGTVENLMGRKYGTILANIGGTPDARHAGHARRPGTGRRRCCWAASW